MKKQFIIIGIVLLFICVGLSGCEESADDTSKFIGTWKWGEETLTFFSDGTYDRNNFSGIYEIKNEKLVLGGTNEPSLTSVYYYSFSDNDSKLTLTPEEGGLTTVLLKQ
ncbi:MAG: hypothetical protein JSW60_04340 [Thermoplasmatales archaeon]|nr:MAG: hypothetical protein JSW60_04340 [Thermoplasmatales archaeon]